MYSDKSAASAEGFISRTIALFRAMEIVIASVLTDNGKEFTSRWGKTHVFEEYLKSRGIEHKYTKVRCPWTNGYAKRFNRTLREEFLSLRIIR